MQIIGFAAFIIIGYLSGGIMFSYLLPKWFCGVDVTQAGGDGNPGTINALRECGATVGILCLILDMLKGFLPVFVGSRLLDTQHPLFGLVIAAPVLGHAFTYMLHFKGGKAIATSYGVLLGIIDFSIAAVVLAGIMIFFSAIVQIYPHALRITLCALLFALYHILWQSPPALMIGCMMVSGVMIFKHIPSLSEGKVSLHVFRLKLGD